MAAFTRAQAGKQAPPIQLTLKRRDREALEALLSRGLISARIFKRARVLQLLDAGRRSCEVCEALGTTRDLVRRIGLRYLEEGLDAALFERERPGGERKLSVQEEAEVAALACSSPPEGYARWTVRLLAREAVARGLVEEVGRETVRVLLAEHGIKPWREKKVLHPCPHAQVPRADGGHTQVV
jgi:putative transposase